MVDDKNGGNIIITNKHILQKSVSTATPDDSDPQKPATELPKTGDDTLVSTLMLVVGIAFLALLVGILILKAKRIKK
ncbi:hypothetical protein [Lactococcus lactis]|uniref:hypothetical protein n=1 Tax=Lactococcus lactis TaxID=1358 RepID=UPI003A4E2736